MPVYWFHFCAARISPNEREVLMRDELILSTEDKRILLEALLEYQDQITRAGNALFTESRVRNLLTRIHESLEADEHGAARQG